MGEEERARKEIKALSQEHQELNDKIDKITSDAVFDQLLVQRLKRRKLQIKDKIASLQSYLCEDIIA